MEFISFIVGLIFGGIVMFMCGPRKKTKMNPSGTFVIDFSNPMKDVCRFELAEDLNSIYTKKQILLNVETHDLEEVSPK